MRTKSKKRNDVQELLHRCNSDFDSRAGLGRWPDKNSCDK